MNRRRFHKLSLGTAAGLAAERLLAAPKINSVVNGVTIGAQSYSFRDRHTGAAIRAFAEVGIGLCELWSGHLERGHGSNSSPEERERLRKWRETVPLDEIEAVGKQFRGTGIDTYALNYSFRDDFSDREMERGFEMAKAFGAKVITSSSNVATAARIDPFAKKHGMRVGLHNHSRIHEDALATPESFDRARKGCSDYIAINLDIGHFTAANFDAVDYIRQHHDDIVTLHIKDRKRNQGGNAPFGRGDTPIREVLALLRDNQYKIPANIEYEYTAVDAVEEVRKCFAYCRQALESG